MSRVLTRDEVKAELPAFALGALDADERAAVQDGLARYPELRAELAAHTSVVQGLGETVAQRVPPAALKSAILAKAQSTGQPQPPSQAWWQKLLRWLSMPTALPRMALTALVLVSAFALVQVARTLPIGLNLSTEQQQANTVLESATERVRLNGTQRAPDAWAEIQYAPGQRQAAMRVGKLPPLPPTLSYQLWLVDASGTRWSGAVFNTTQTQSQLVLVNCPEPIEGMVRFGVSVEPAGGSRIPTSSAVLRSRTTN